MIKLESCNYVSRLEARKHKARECCGSESAGTITSNCFRTAKTAVFWVGRYSVDNHSRFSFLRAFQRYIMCDIQASKYFVFEKNINYQKY